MDNLFKQEAASELEFAERLFYLAIDHLERIAKEYPELNYFVTEYISSISEGEAQLGGIDEVVDFLRTGRDAKDHFAEDYLLVWKKKDEPRPKKRLAK